MCRLPLEVLLRLITCARLRTRVNEPHISTRTLPIPSVGFRGGKISSLVWWLSLVVSLQQSLHVAAAGSAVQRNLRCAAPHLDQPSPDVGVQDIPTLRAPRGRTSEERPMGPNGGPRHGNPPGSRGGTRSEGRRLRVASEGVPGGSRTDGARVRTRRKRRAVGMRGAGAFLSPLFS